MSQKTFIVSSLNSNLYTTKRFLEESKKLNYSQISYLNPLDFSIPQTFEELEGIFLHRSTGVNFDDFDLLIAQHFEHSGLRISNPLSAIFNFRNKDTQALFLRSQNIPTINSLVFRGPLSEDLKAKLAALAKNQQYVLKTNRGNQGIGVSFINGLTSLYSVLETLKAMRDQKFLIQPFIEHQKEYRLLIIKNEIHAVIEKTIEEGDFRGNSKRTKATLITQLDPELKDLAHKCFEISGLDYAGLDILRDTSGQYHLVEINSVCGFEQVETLSGLNIAREIILSLN